MMEHNGFEYIDLDLPSGTLWATMNVGANDVCDNGLYFQWGKVVGFTINDIQMNKMVNFSEINSVCCANLWEGDGVNAYMGGKWRMPTKYEFMELVNFTTIDKGYDGGITLMNNNGKVFFPYNGYIDHNYISYCGIQLNVWSSSTDNINIKAAVDFSCEKNKIVPPSMKSFSPYWGHALRGVINKNDL